MRFTRQILRSRHFYDERNQLNRNRKRWLMKTEHESLKFRLWGEPVEPQSTVGTCSRRCVTCGLSEGTQQPLHFIWMSGKRMNYGNYRHLSKWTAPVTLQVFDVFEHLVYIPVGIWWHRLIWWQHPVCGSRRLQEILKHIRSLLFGWQGEFQVCW